MRDIPETIRNEQELETFLATPYPETVEMMKRIDGDIMVLGAGGKMGPSLARLAKRACREAGADKRIIGVSDVFDDKVRNDLDSDGIETIVCDLIDPTAVEKLPRATNIIYMVGRKFGEEGTEALTWVVNVVVPANVGRIFRDSRITAFSTGCVYRLESPESDGSVETDEPDPVGEYANSCLGRERSFEYCSREFSTPVLLFRLNYSIDLRYGVLVDIAQAVNEDRPVDLTVNAVNVIWQGDAINRALLSLELASVPAFPLNVTGPETLVVEAVAKEFGELLGKEVKFAGKDSGKAYLNNARRSIDIFGPPRVTAQTMIRWVVDWIRSGNPLLGKPTLFQITDGEYLAKK
jgi:hypothetical protein